MHTNKHGDVARFKEKGNEFATAVPGALTIGMANTISSLATSSLLISIC